MTLFIRSKNPHVQIEDPKVAKLIELPAMNDKVEEYVKIGLRRANKTLKRINSNFEMNPSEVTAFKTALESTYNNFHGKPLTEKLEELQILVRHWTEKVAERSRDIFAALEEEERQNAQLPVVVVK